MDQLKHVMKAKVLRKKQLAKYKEKMKEFKKNKAKGLPAQEPEKVVEKKLYID